MFEAFKELFRQRPPEPYNKRIKICKTCQVLQEQLAYERERNRELTSTLTSMLKPQPIIQDERGRNPLLPMPRGGMWSRRRAELERVDRESAKLEKTSQVIAKPDEEIKVIENRPQQTIEELEKELGVITEEPEKENAS
jgi:hypothetical protein